MLVKKETSIAITILILKVRYTNMISCIDYTLSAAIIRFCFAVGASYLGALILGGPRQLPSLPILKASFAFHYWIVII